MWSSLLFVLCQAGVSAGGAQTACDGSVVTLWAKPTGGLTNYTIQWDGAVAPGVFHVVNPTQTTSYRVELVDHDSGMTYEDTTRILVHPGNSDLDDNGMYNDDDWGQLYAAWGAEPAHTDFDPDDDGRVSVLDWFFICNFDRFPPNTPPSLSVSSAFTQSGDSVVVAYDLEDAEQIPTLHITQQPANGFVTLISGVLRYSPDLDYVGTDTFYIHASDGIVQTPDLEVPVTVLAPDTYTNLLDDIFWPHCEACHLDGVVSGGLALDTYELAQAGGNNGASFLAGFPENSPLYIRVANGSMPLGQPPLSQEDIERIRIWILKGAAP